MDESIRITARAACLFLLASYAEPLRLEFFERGVRHLGAGTRLVDRADVDAALSGLALDGLVSREAVRGRGGGVRFSFAPGAPPARPRRRSPPRSPRSACTQRSPSAPSARLLSALLPVL